MYQFDDYYTNDCPYQKENNGYGYDDYEKESECCGKHEEKPRCKKECECCCEKKKKCCCDCCCCKKDHKRPPCQDWDTGCRECNDYDNSYDDYDDHDEDEKGKKDCCCCDCCKTECGEWNCNPYKNCRSKKKCFIPLFHCR